MKKLLPFFLCLPCIADVTVSNVAFEQNETTKDVEITYDLGGSDAEAIVTIDVLFNGESIGDENIQFLTGDVNKKLTVSTGKKITWAARKSWPGHVAEAGQLSVAVNAWSLDNPPDYVVADVEAPSVVRYYASSGAVPNGIGDDAYKTGKLLLRRIHAKGVTWTMGSSSGRSPKNRPHEVTLDHDYYIGVYQFTLGQWFRMTNFYPTWIYSETIATKREMRPICYVSYAELRETATKNVGNPGNDTFDLDAAHRWPNAPAEKSLMGLLRSRTGLAFDLPCESEWEYAARGGLSGEVWGDGSAILGSAIDANLEELAWYSANTAKTWASGLPEIVGTKKPNLFGLYDCHGNVWECCVDAGDVDITNLGGAVCTDYSALKIADRAAGPHKDALSQHPSFQDWHYMNKAGVYLGFRPVVRIE